MVNVTVILGSTRTVSTGDKIFHLLKNIANEKNLDINYTEYSAIKPFNVLAEPINGLPPLKIDVLANSSDVEKYESPVIREFSKAMSKSDSFLFLLPVYNHSYPGTFKIMLDHLFSEFKGKPVFIVGYGPGAPETVVNETEKLVAKFKMDVIGKEIVRLSYTDNDWLLKQKSTLEKITDVFAKQSKSNQII